MEETEWGDAGKRVSQTRAAASVNSPTGNFWQAWPNLTDQGRFKQGGSGAKS